MVTKREREKSPYLVLNSKQAAAPLTWLRWGRRHDRGAGPGVRFSSGQRRGQKWGVGGGRNREGGSCAVHCSRQKQEPGVKGRARLSDEELVVLKT